MTARPRFETLLREALGRAGEPAPFSVDVADRVMARIEELGPPVRAEVGARQLVRWAIAASLVGVGLLAVAVWCGPNLNELVAALGRTTAGATGTMVKLSAPAGALAAVLGRIGHALIESAQTLVSPLAPFQPLARALLQAIAMAMLGVTAFVVLRDVRVGVAQHKEIS